MGSRQFGISVDGSGGKTARSIVVALIFCLGFFSQLSEGFHLSAADQRSPETVGGQEQRWPQTTGLSQIPETTEASLQLKKSLPTRAISPANGSGVPSEKTRRSDSSSLWGTVGSLAFVLTLIAVAVRWMKTYGPAAVRGLPSSAIEVLGRRPLEPRVSLQIVRCGTRVLILGLGPDGARTLSEITDPVEVDLIVGACRTANTEPSQRPSFANLFESIARPQTGAPLRSPLSHSNRSQTVVGDILHG